MLSADHDALVMASGHDGVAGVIVAARDMSRELLRRQVSHRPLGSYPALLKYLRADLADRNVEAIRVLFLDSRNRLLRDLLIAEGTIDTAPLYMREIVRKGLNLGATGLIVVHNHPGGDPTPSDHDLAITRQLVEACAPVGMMMHDHIIVAAGGVSSMRTKGLPWNSRD